MRNLSEKKCTPCQGDTPTLPKEKVREYLGLVEGWAQEQEQIKKTFSFTNFTEALAFFNEVARVAEEEDHHPDMCIQGWKNVTLSLTTHAVGGLTDNDFIIAAKINHLKARA